jgi:ubiquinone/menaquinone biosynthesis C-methylase UbiE
MNASELAYKVPEKMYRKFPEQSRQFLESIVRFIGPNLGETIVDVGTGAGFLAFGLAEKVGKKGRVIGLDISKSAIRQARKRLAKQSQYQMLEFRVSDVYAIPFEDNFADVVCCKSLIVGLDSRQKAIREMARVAKHWGRVVAAEPAELVGLPSQIKKAFYKTASGKGPFFDEHKLKNLFQRAGLKSIETKRREPPIVTDVATFEWTTKNLFGEHGLWELAVEEGVDEDKVIHAHKKLIRQIETTGLKFGTGVVFCKGVKL